MRFLTDKNVCLLKSEELKARLRQLAERAERDEYRELVKDILPKSSATEPFSSYKDRSDCPVDLFAKLSQVLLQVFWCLK